MCFLSASLIALQSLPFPKSPSDGFDHGASFGAVASETSCGTTPANRPPVGVWAELGASCCFGITQAQSALQVWQSFSQTALPSCMHWHIRWHSDCVANFPSLPRPTSV